MKLRFNRQTPAEFVETLREVKTLSELHCELISECNLKLDDDVTEAFSITLYDEYVNPIISFGKKNYAIKHRGLIIGFADSDISSFQDESNPEKAKEEPASEKQTFYIDNREVEHTCCWSSMIMKDGKNYAECEKANSKFICDALNEAYKKLEEKNAQEKLERAAAHRQRNGIV